jgi:hypothetical protein
VKKIIAPVMVNAIIINSVLLGAMSGASDVRIRNVSFNDPKDKTVKIIASAFHLFIYGVILFSGMGLFH